MTDVSAHVLLGDSKTRKEITKAVTIKLKLTDDDSQTYDIEVLCYVLDAPATTPIILGLPAIISTDLYFYFTKILKKGFKLMGFDENATKRKTDLFLNHIDEVGATLIPWPSAQEPISPEEMETVVPDSFADCLSFLTTTREEAEDKHKEDVSKFVDPRWKAHKSTKYPDGIESYLNSEEVKSSFLPTSWEGFKNMAKCGANENDEFELNWDEENFPSSLDSKLRPIPSRLHQVVSKELDRLNNYLWEDSDSPVCSPLTVAPKATSPFIRIAGDMRPVNPFIHVPKEYIPNVQAEIQKMSGFRYFADIDQTNSFHQIKLALRSRRRLTVKTPLGLKQPKFVPEGISPGSAMLQRINRKIYEPMQDCMVVLFDNLLIGGHDYDDLQDKLIKFFAISREHNVTLKMAKSRFGQEEANFFGYVVKQNGYELSEERKASIKDMTFPRSLKQMQSFLGMALFFKPFIDRYSSLTAKLNDTTKSDFNWQDRSSWKYDYEYDFDKVKEELQGSLKLFFPDYNKKFILRTDASKVAVGGILLQLDEETGQLQPIAMVSTKLSDTATRWDAYKLECFAVYYCVKQLNHFLLGKEFIVETDHQNLQWMEKNDSAIVMRWRWYLQNYKLLVKHIPGKANTVADYLSRMYACNEDTNQQLDQALHAMMIYKHHVETTIDPDVLNITLKHKRFEVQYQLRRSNEMHLAIAHFIKLYVVEYTIPYDGFKFYYKDQIVKPLDTPASLGLFDNDVISVIGEPFLPDPINFLSRPSKTLDRKNMRTIEYIDRRTGILTKHYCFLDMSKTISEMPLSFYSKYLHKFDLPRTRGTITVPIRLTTDTGIVIEAVITFQMVPTETPVTLGYEDVLNYYRKLLSSFFQPSTVDTLAMIDHPYGKRSQPDELQCEMTSHLSQLLESEYLASTEVIEKYYDNPTTLILTTNNMWLYEKSYALDPSNSTFQLQLPSQDPSNTQQYDIITSPADILQALNVTVHSVQLTHPMLRNVLQYNGFKCFSTIVINSKSYVLALPSHVQSAPKDKTYKHQLSVTVDSVELIHKLRDQSSTSTVATFRIIATSAPNNKLALQDVVNRLHLNAQDASTSHILECIKRHDPSHYQLLTKGKGHLDAAEAIIPNRDPDLHAINPIYSIGLSPHRDFNALPQYILQSLKNCARNVQVTSPIYSAITDRFLIVFDSGMATPRSAISKSIVSANPDLFNPLYYDTNVKGGYTVTGAPTIQLGECTLSLTSQHDSTGALYTSLITFRIIDSSRDIFILSYLDCVQNFYEPYMSYHASYKMYLTHRRSKLFENAGYPNAKALVTKNITFKADGTSSPTRSPLLASVSDAFCLPCTLCPSCDILAKTTPSFDALSHMYNPPFHSLSAVQLLSHLFSSPTADFPEQLGDGEEKDQGETSNNNTNTSHNNTGSMLLSHDASENLRLWCKELHGGFNLHMGAKRMFSKARHLFPGHQLPFKFFEEFVASCGTCQKMRQSMALAFQALVKTLKIPLVPRSHVGIDTALLPRDIYGNRYLHIIVQLFSKLVYAYASPDNSAESVCNALLMYFATHGIFNVMRMDPGSNLTAKAVQLLNEQFGITQKISMVDVHTSSGVENGGVQQVKRHLTALCSDHRIKDKWSDPRYLQWCLLMMNDSLNSETNDKPFRLHWGDYDELAKQFPETYPESKTTTTKYIQELWRMQRIAVEASKDYQSKLHDKRISKTPQLLQNKYQPGDYVLKLRTHPINTKTLQWFKYAGPFIVDKQEDNFVYVHHATSNIPRVFPVERLVIFDNSRDEAKRVAILDDDEFYVNTVIGFKGSPFNRSNMQFLVMFEDEADPTWVKYHLLEDNEAFKAFILATPSLQPLTMPASEVSKFIKQQNTTITEVKVGDRAYVDIRHLAMSTNGKTYDDLLLPDAYTKTYVTLGVYEKLSDQGKTISIFFKDTNTKSIFTRSMVLWYGTISTFDNNNMILVDQALLKLYPQLSKGKFARSDAIQSSKRTQQLYVKQRTFNIEDKSLVQFQYSGPYRLLQSVDEHTSIYVHDINGRNETINDSLLVQLNEDRLDQIQLPTGTDLPIRFLGYEGDPMKSHHVTMYIQFYDEEPEWANLIPDFFNLSSFNLFANSIKAFEVIGMTAQEASTFRSALDKTKILNTHKEHTLLIDLRALCVNTNFLWYRKLKLKDYQSKRYVFTAKVTQLSKSDTLINISSKHFPSLTLSHSTMKWYTHTVFDHTNMVLIDDDFIKSHKDILQ